jgi:catechol 2,3-dioxygenase-like lactoylglutathione lyase family enzyme
MNAVISVCIPVADMDRSIDFYTTVLSCQKISDSIVTGVNLDCYGLTDLRMRVVKLQLGEESIELTEFLTPKGMKIPADSRSNDRWFQHIAIVVSDMDRAYQHLRDRRVSQTSPAPQTLPDWNPVAGGIQSYYFRDPDGHNLELIHFPDDKGDPKWHRSIDSLFLGIDHTAIVVANTATSRAFYCDRLGLKLQQESQNYGLEQELLSGISDAKVRISSLKAAVGISIELLEYLEPQDGRPIPTDTRPNDLWCWQTTIEIPDLLSTLQQLTTDAMPFSALELDRVSFVGDPDRHLIRLADR